MTAPDNIAAWLEQPANAAPGTFGDEDLELAWSKDRVYATNTGEFEPSQEILVSDILAIQVSRARDEAPRRWWRKLLGLRPVTRDVLNVSLRTRGGENLRLNAPADKTTLAGLPWMQQSKGLKLPQQPLLDLVATLRHAGVSVAAWSPDVTHQQRAGVPEKFALKRQYPRAIYILLGIWLVIPGLLLIASNWLRPRAWIVAFGFLVCAAVIYALLRCRVVWIERRGSQRILELCSLVLPPRWVPLDGLERLILRHHNQSGAWELYLSGTERDPVFLASGKKRSPGDSESGQKRQNDADDRPATPEDLAASASGVLGLELEKEEGWPQHRRSGAVYFLACVLMTVLAGWTAERLPGEREVTRLGGWFTGNGSLLAAVTGSLTMDYSLIGSPEEVELTALSPDGRWAATGSGAKLMLWNAQTGELVQELEEMLVGVGNWVDFSRDGEKLYAVVNENSKPRLKRWTVEDWSEDHLSNRELAEEALYHSFESEAYCARAAEDFRYFRYGNGILQIISTDGSFSGRHTLARVSLPFHLRSPDTLVFSPDCGTVWLMDFSQHEACWIDTNQDRDSDRGDSRLKCAELPEVDDDYRETVMAGDNDGRRLAYFVNGSVAVIERGHPTAPVQVIGGEWENNPWLYRPRMAFSPDGRLVVSVNHFSGFNAAPARVYVFGEDYALQGVLEGHFDGVTAPLRFNGDGSLLLTGSRDQTARIWEMP